MTSHPALAGAAANGQSIAVRRPDGARQRAIRGRPVPHSVSAFALRASADLKPAVARPASEGGALHAGYAASLFRLTEQRAQNQNDHAQRDAHSHQQLDEEFVEVSHGCPLQIPPHDGAAGMVNKWLI